MTVAGRPLVPAVAIPDEGLGPCMLALSPPMRAFVHFKVHLGFSNAKAARAAGYSSEKPENAKVNGYTLAHREDIAAAVIEESRRVMASEGPRSIKTLIEIRDDKKCEAKDRIKAAVELLNRGGLNAISEHHLTVEHTMTDAQKDQRILALCRELGIADVEARKMLVAPDAIDGEFTEIPPAELTPEQVAEREHRDRENARRRELRAASPEERERLKAEERARRTAEQKARYAAAQGRHTDIEEFIAGQGTDNLSDLMAPVPGDAP